MSMKLDLGSAVEPGHGQSSGASSSLSASISSPKIFMRGAKSGFVIPKNKLSGSMVPIVRGSKKQDGGEEVNEDNGKQVQRRTKWGPDLTQDAAVRRGRALAYQTRVDQIARQLKSGITRSGGDQDSDFGAEDPDQEFCSHPINKEEAEELELEKREVIGEILKLNPSYKVPSDYKPLLKEAKVPISIKEYPGFNFLGLIFGPGRDTQKKLEKEIGVKIQVYGTRAGSEDKAEITSPDEKGDMDDYKELYVLISADTYEKVDAAVSLFELLVKPVPGKPTTSNDDQNAQDTSQGTTTPYVVPTSVVEQGLVQQAGPPQGHCQYPVPWLAGPQGLMRPPTGFPSSGNIPPLNPSNPHSIFGTRPPLAGGYVSTPQNPSLLLPRSLPPILGQTSYMPRNYPPPGPQPLPAQYNISNQAPFPRTQQPPSSGFSTFMQPLMPPFPRPGQAPNPIIMGQMARPVVSSQGPRAVPPQPVSLAPTSLTFTPQVSNISMNRPISSPILSLARPQSASSVPPTPAPASIQFSSSVGPVQPATAARAQIPVLPSGPMPNFTTSPSMPSATPISVSGGFPNFSPVIPSPVAAPKPQPNSSDFTFQPQHPQGVAVATPQSIPQPRNQFSAQNHLHPNPPVQTSRASQAPSFQMGGHYSAPHAQILSRPPPAHQIGQPQMGPSPVPFSGRPTSNFTPSRSPATPNPRPSLPQFPASQVGPGHFSHPSQITNVGPRPGNPMQFQQNYPPPRPPRSGINLGANPPPLSSNVSFVPGRPASRPSSGQNYDPFSPTSVSGAPATGKQESDPEYEDLMASVGVK